MREPRREGATHPVPSSIRPGDVLAGRYLLVDLLSESGDGRFWRAVDRILERPVAVHVLPAGDDNAAAMTAAARSSAAVSDRRILRVLDVDERDGLSYVVNEWGSGTSLDRLVADDGPVSARRAAWVVSEVADTITTAHESGVAHGRLVPENVLIDTAGQVRVIGCSVDAALLGLPPGRLSSDVVDLGGLLYFLLTGKWAGMSRSGVPSAPHEAGAVLRPRRVKAGIPRPLDALCDQVLNPYAEPAPDPDLRSARGICEALRDFVGDPAGIAAAELGRAHSGSSAETRMMPLPQLPDPPAPASTDPSRPPAAPERARPGPDPQPTADQRSGPAAVAPAQTPRPAPRSRSEAPTQAGMPVFDDDNDDVSWFAARAEVPPPPPPFEEPPERPLFAPDPADGTPTRRARPSGSNDPGSPDYWPWETGASVTGSGVLPSVPDDEDDEAPGRSWLRLAALVAVSSLLLLAVVFAFNLGRGRSPLGELPAEDQPSTTPAATPSADAVPLEVTGAADLDPQGDPPEENRELVPLSVDGDPGTSWRSSTYAQNFGPGGLKTGLGLVVDLGKPHDVSAVKLTLVGEPTGVSLFVTERSPTGVSALEPVQQLTASARERIDLDEPVTGRFVLVWLTSLPEVDDGYRAEIAEIEVLG